MSPLERKWWFIAPVSSLSAIMTILLVLAADLPFPLKTFYQYIVYFFVFLGISKMLSGLGWFAILLIAPNKLDTLNK